MRAATAAGRAGSCRVHVPCLLPTDHYFSIYPSKLGLSGSHRIWTKVSSHYVSGVFMAGANTAFGVGQLAPKHNPSEPTALLK